MRRFEERHRCQQCMLAIRGAAVLAAMSLGVAFAKSGVVCGQSMADVHEMKSRFVTEMEDAEVLFFLGSFDEALRLCAEAGKAVEAERKGKTVFATGDPLLLESVADVLEAEIRCSQGYLGAATSALESAKKKLTTRAVYWARRGASGNDLKAYNFRLGYIEMCLGDVDLIDARIHGVVTGDQTAIKKCRSHYEEGIKIIRNTYLLTDAKDFDLQKRLMTKCDIRYARLLALDGDILRARSCFNDAEKVVKSDPLWIQQFSPEGQAGAALAGASAGKGTAPVQPTQVQNNAGSQSPQAASTLVNDRGDSLEATNEEREKTRTVLHYLDLLSTQVELNLADKKPVLAEEAAVLARDIAEERFPDAGVFHDATVLLSRVYCACYEDALRRSREHKDEVVELDGQLVNVYEKAAESYLRDARDLTEQTATAVQEMNASRPIHFAIMEVKKQVAALRKDAAAIASLDAEIQRLSSARKADKPRSTPRR